MGKLSLADTAALLRECAALISNDSGLMRLGVALGVPTFGILASRARRMRHARAVFFPSRKNCRARRRAMPALGDVAIATAIWSAESLTPEEVFMKVNQLIPYIAEQTSRPARVPIASPPVGGGAAKETINLAYYG